MNISDYQVGDNVLINSEEHKKRVIGCIEELDENEGSFTYGLYVFSKDIPMKQYYHGNFELFKTSSTFTDKIKSIEKFVEVLKFKDYAMREQPTEERPFYVIRQYYDIQENTLTPEEPKPCLCEKVVNPDGNIVMCFNCNDLFYHDKCLQPGSKCSGCSSTLKDEMVIGVKRSNSLAGIHECDIPNLLQQSKSKSQQLDIIEEDEPEEIEPTKMRIDTNQMKQMFEQAKQARLKQQEEKKKQIQNHQKVQQENKSMNQPKNPVPLKKENSFNLEFANLNVQQNEKIVSLVNRYKKFNPVGNLNGPEKKRMEVREKFFEFVVYGVQEFELNESSLSDDERKILLQDPYEIARKLAVEIESNVFNINNRQNKYALTENYKQRCKLLFANLKDSLNFNLRRKIINKSLKPQTLCTMSEIEMYNPTKLQDIEDQKMKILNRDTINLNDKMYILKTNKGEEIIDMREEKEPEQEELKVQGEANIPVVTVKATNNASNGFNPTSHSDSEEKNIKNNLHFIHSSEQLISEDALDSKNNRNPLIDQSIIDSLLNFIGEKAIKRMQERLFSDLPEKEAKYLVAKLNN